MKDEKYVVFKRSDWEDLVEAMESTGTGTTHHQAFRNLQDRALMDLTVIRHQDWFAGPALWAYAHGVQLTLKGLQSNASMIDARLIERLRRTAAYFEEAALNADEVGCKFPD